MKDLIVLVADADMRSTISGLLLRPQSLGIRPISFDIRVHAQRDAGCRSQGDSFMRQFHSQYHHALVMFDREGCGQDAIARTDLENDMEQRLSATGWDERASCVVFDPELEIWVWSGSPHVARALGWPDGGVELREHLTQKSYFTDQEQKPARPKEAMLEALKVKRKPHSASLFQTLAEKVGFRSCSDEAFLKFKMTLQMWFSPT